MILQTKSSSLDGDLTHLMGSKSPVKKKHHPKNKPLSQVLDHPSGNEKIPTCFQKMRNTGGLPPQRWHEKTLSGLECLS